MIEESSGQVNPPPKKKIKMGGDKSSAVSDKTSRIKAEMNKHHLMQLDFFVKGDRDS